MDLICLGEILIDLFPAEIGCRLAEVTAFRPKPGGAPANVAVAAARLGFSTAFIGKVGADAFGEHLIATLEQEGVVTRGMRRDPQARTTLAFIAMPDPHHAEFVFYRNPGADLQLRAAELDHALLGSARALHCGSLSLVAEPARTASFTAVGLARQAGALISFDVNFRPSLWPAPEAALEQIQALIPQVDVLKVNEIELRLLGSADAGQLDAAGLAAGCQELLGRGPHLVIVTLGQYGSFFATRAVSGFVPAFKVATVDATGCGDAFVAGLLTRLLQGDDWQAHLTAASLKAALRYANAVGALTALTQGVIPALPRAAQVAEFLASAPETVSGLPAALVDPV
ncbi:MAG: PfkB family carbohydrate kinase [Anaerolineales bacterium]